MTASARSEASKPWAVRVRGLRKRYGYREALRGIDFDLGTGACLVVRGPNGAGKSTLLAILAGLRSFDGGEVYVLGEDLRGDAREARARVGVLLHENFLRSELTVEENLRFACDLYGLRFREAEGFARTLLERMGLSGRGRDLVGSLSQGLARRLGIARSLLHAPDLWLLDEPQAGLDAEGCEILLALLREHVASGRSAIVATHDPTLGTRLGAEALWLSDGAIEKREPAPGGPLGGDRP